MGWLPFILVAFLAVFLLWELWICEGAHLGRRFVVFLYDLAANRYDRIKDFDQDWERRFLGDPVAATIRSLGDARLLDVGAGTGRLARAIFSGHKFRGTFVCLEPSRRMLELGRRIAAFSGILWARGWAADLPFPADTFDIVSSLEVLEFTPNPRRTLAEIVRVLRPGGWLLVTNRIGWQAPLILGRTFSRRRFPTVLESLGVEYIEVYPWQMDYDLIWARKAISGEEGS